MFSSALSLYLTAMFKDLVDPEFGGYGTVRRVERGTDDPRMLFLDDHRSSEVHAIYFYLRTAKVACRWASSAQAKTWHPNNASPGNDAGISIFKKDAVLPALDAVPAFAPFKIPFKNQDKVQQTILSLNAEHPTLFSPEAHKAWVEIFKSLPTSPSDSENIEPTKVPSWILQARPIVPEPTADEVLTTELVYRPPDRSTRDVMDDPIVHPMTYSEFPRAERRKLVGAINTGTPGPGGRFFGSTFLVLFGL